jgi:hypothetical protein
MELWRGDIPEFLDAVQSRSIVPQMLRQFDRWHGGTPSPSEVKSWEVSLTALGSAVDGQASDVGVSVEYHLPLSGQRIDVMFLGRDCHQQANAVVVELKHWDTVNIEDEFSMNVLVGDAEHLHPSQQAQGYVDFLDDVHSAFVDGAVKGHPCAYCHEMNEEGETVLRDARFRPLLTGSPLFVRTNSDDLGDYIADAVGAGGGLEVLEEVRTGRFKPSRKVIECLADVIERDKRWHLLESQQLAYNAVLAEVRRAVQREGRSAFLIRGGPGTGKTVIAVQLLADVLKLGLTAAHSTGGKAFTTAMRAAFKGADKLFIWNLSTRKAKRLGLDLLLVDEAHRIRRTSDTRFTPARDRDRKAQVDELLDASRVVVFLLDEHQYVRPDEIGRSLLIRHAASLQAVPLKEYDLATQFRCGGCTEYVDWVDYLLGFRPAPPEHGWKGRFAVDLAGDPTELDDLMELAQSKGKSSRLLAGFCWEWSDQLKDGGLVDDVAIGGWRRPWNRKRSERKTYTPENDPYTLWATSAEGQEQVGCVYSAQGFEFDHVGVVWGEDLVWRKDRWVAQKLKCFDRPVKSSSEMELLVRNAYRVLLTRGLSRVRVLCLDEETRSHVAGALKVMQ